VTKSIEIRAQQLDIIMILRGRRFIAEIDRSREKAQIVMRVPAPDDKSASRLGTLDVYDYRRGSGCISCSTTLLQRSGQGQEAMIHAFTRTSEVPHLSRPKRFFREVPRPNLPVNRPVLLRNSLACLSIEDMHPVRW
jgi:hypothetical protein